MRIHGVIIATAVVLMAACIPELDPGPQEPGDLSPPALLSWQLTDADSVAIRFDEAVTVTAEDYLLHNGGEPEAASACEYGDSPDCIVVTLASIVAPGKPCMLDGRAQDEAGNSITFSVPLWGYNESPARLIINEILCQGSSTRPDWVEFRVLAGGNLAGLCCAVGSLNDYEHRYVFPNRLVESGDYVVLHLKPLGNPLEKDELDAKDQSGGMDANTLAWDFWYRGDGGGLPGSNGAVSLALSPMGAYEDALLYSDRTSASDEKYRGFGTAAMLARADAINAAAMWLAAGALVAPEDCFRPTGTTSTRTLCRLSSGLDSDAASDWHIVPTKGATPGAVNSDEVYVP